MATYNLISSKTQNIDLAGLTSAQLTSALASLSSFESAVESGTRSTKATLTVGSDTYNIISGRTNAKVDFTYDGIKFANYASLTAYIASEANEATVLTTAEAVAAALAIDKTTLTTANTTLASEKATLTAQLATINNTAFATEQDAFNAGKLAGIAESAAAQASSGMVFALSSNADTLTPNNATAANKTGNGDDLFRAPVDGLLHTIDYIDGGLGNDTLNAAITANGQTIVPALTSIENITLTVKAVNEKNTTFDATDVVGANNVTIKNAGAVSHGATAEDESITVNNLAKTTTLGIVGGTASAGTTGSIITATFADAKAADTQKVAISTLGKTAVLTLSTAETVEITATGTGKTGANAIGTLSAIAVKTLNLKGSGDLTVADSDLAATTTVNASAATGKVSFDAEAGTTSFTFTGGSGATTVTGTTTGIVNVTTGAADDTVNLSAGDSTSTVNTGAGADRVLVGAQTNVTAADSINGGDGTDTIVVTTATINGTTKTELAKGASGFEIVETTSVGTSIDFNALSTYNTVAVSAADAGVTAAVDAAAAANGTNGAASINVTTIENSDALVISASRKGQAGQAIVTDAGTNTAGNGGNAITLTPFLDGGSSSVSLKIIGNSDFTGGAGGAKVDNPDTAGTGGSGISAANIEALTIDVSGTKEIDTGVVIDVVTIRGGSANGTTLGTDTVVGTNATITLTSSLTGADAGVHNDIDLGTVKGTNVTINGSAFKGNITATAADGNVTLIGGAGNDTLTGGIGTDSINGGAGNDIITSDAGADVLSGGTGRDSFTIVTAGHSGTTLADKISDFGKVTVAATAAQVTAMNSVAAFQATATAQGGANTDILDMATTATLATAAAGTDVSGQVTGGGVVVGAISAKGVVTVSGAQAANVDTLAEWVAVAKLMTAPNNVAAFEFGGNTFVYQEGTTDDLVQLTGVTGVTGIVLAGGTAAAAAGDIFVI